MSEPEYESRENKKTQGENTRGIFFLIFFFQTMDE